MRAFIVTTVREPGRPLLSFIRYHLSLGFERIILYFDDPGDPCLPVARTLAGVTAIPCTAELRRDQRGGRIWAKMEPHLDREVMARQAVNADHAIDVATAAGADWLLHLDADELFCCADPVAEHFAQLADDIGQVVYLNHEAMPPTAEVDDYFREVTLFKVNPAISGPLVERWRRSGGRRWFFLAYDNGKAAVRLGPGSAPRGVHAFEPSARHPRTVCTANPCILHYPHCGFQWYRLKYQLLGDFSDRYFEQSPRISFHLQSRDLFAAGDQQAQRRFYVDHAVYGDQAEVRAMLDLGIAARIAEPRLLLGAG